MISVEATAATIVHDFSLIVRAVQKGEHDGAT
jgi:hypothetical protein